MIASQVQTPEERDLIDAAARASEIFGDDELEAYAERVRSQRRPPTTFGAELSRLRTERRLRQRAFTSVHVHQDLISHLEAGRRLPNLATLAGVIHVLNEAGALSRRDWMSLVTLALMEAEAKGNGRHEP